jgi:hypothetical protein
LKVFPRNFKYTVRKPEKFARVYADRMEMDQKLQTMDLSLEEEVIYN